MKIIQSSLRLNELLDAVGMKLLTYFSMTLDMFISVKINVLTRELQSKIIFGL